MSLQSSGPLFDPGQGGWFRSRHGGIREQLPVILVWSCMLLLPFGRLVELPVLIMAVLAIRLIVRHGWSVCWHGSAKLFTIIFLLIWIPAVISAFDAVNLEKTLRTVLGQPRLYFAGLFIVYHLSTPTVWQHFLRLSSWLLLFWLGDALFQAVAGFDLFGFKRIPLYLNGVFGEHRIKMGIVLAAFTPLLFEYARRNWVRSVQLMVFLATLLVILLSGSRAAWIMFGVLTVAYVVLIWKEQRKAPVRLITLLVFLLTVTFVSTYHFSNQFSSRVETSLLVLQGENAAIDAAVSWRLPIWSTAIKMIKHHPINGVGARSFRYAYPLYAAPGDRFITPGSPVGAFHSHQLFLDITSETGLIGLAGLVTAMALLARVWLKTDNTQRYWMVPGGLAVLVAFFPINTHFALFSSFWSQIVWWLIALYCAGSKVEEKSLNLGSK